MELPIVTKYNPAFLANYVEPFIIGHILLEFVPFA